MKVSQQLTYVNLKTEYKKLEAIPVIYSIYYIILFRIYFSDITIETMDQVLIFILVMYIRIAEFCGIISD